MHVEMWSSNIRNEAPPDKRFVAPHRERNVMMSLKSASHNDEETVSPERLQSGDYATVVTGLVTRMFVVKVDTEHDQHDVFFDQI